MMPGGIVTPDYGVGSLCEVVPSTLAALGVPGWTNALELPPAASYVILLVDGMGWNLLRRHGGETPYLSSLAEQGRAITACVPSTTATSLTSFGTGLPPGTHGLVGFTSRVPGTNRLLDALRWDKRVDPLLFQPHPTAFELASAAGVPVTVVSRRAFETSGLTRVGQRGARYRGADYLGERIALSAEAAGTPGSLTYMYDGELDATGHRHGCESLAWLNQLAMTDRFVEQVRRALPAETALAVIADHGMLDVPLANRVDVEAEPTLSADLTLLGGEARFRHLYCAAEVANAVATRWRDRLGSAALVLRRDEAIDSGWFGAVEPAVLPRIGDVVVASVAEIAIVSSKRFAHEATLIGLHGSLSADEMLVPLLIDPAR